MATQKLVPMDLQEMTAPASPAAGALRVYADTAHQLHVLTSAGADTTLGAGGAALPFVSIAKWGTD